MAKPRIIRIIRLMPVMVNSRSITTPTACGKPEANEKIALGAINWTKKLWINMAIGNPH